MDGSRLDGSRPPRPLIAPSILSADFTRLGEEVARVEAAGAEMIHVDVMDGHFVPNITMGPLVVEAVRGATGLPLDVHLMIDAPEKFIGEFARAGADWLTLHVEACVHLHRSVQAVREAGMRPGVALNPSTPLEAVRWILEDLDFLLLMTVNPGFPAQSFIPGMLPKIRAAREMIRAAGSRAAVEVDGGINPRTAREAVEAGAEILVAGSYIFGAADYAGAVSSLRVEERGGPLS
ncbi:MAG: ribulose-phosphate 3-epimerase [Firmicutes bacterium]|nr:ribulose-phosphate 3-epimerase [Bacillota bacterium]